MYLPKFLQTLVNTLKSFRVASVIKRSNLSLKIEISEDKLLKILSIISLYSLMVRIIRKSDK